MATRLADALIRRPGDRTGTSAVADTRGFSPGRPVKPRILDTVGLSRALVPQEKTMDKDRTEGVGHQIKGAVKEAAGTVTGDAKLKTEGKVERAGGKLQEGVGEGKDTVRDALKD